MAEEKTRLTFEWALWGKKTEDHDYSVLACSEGGDLKPNDFDQILSRFSIGTPAILPQVTFVWSGHDRSTRIGIAIHETSDTPDKVGRRIISTRYFCVPYRQLAEHPISYRELFAQFDKVPLPTVGELSIEVEALSANKIAAEVDDRVMITAALLLARLPVCVVADKAVRLDDRIRFLDAVAAMLPYGMRSKLSASTWTSSTAQHSIRLSFTEDIRDDSYNVRWGGDLPPIPYEADIARQYQALLANHADRETLVTKLASAHRLMPFTMSWRALGVLDSSFRDPYVGGTPIPSTLSEEQLLLLLVDALQEENTDAVRLHISNLNYPRGYITLDRRIRFQQILKERGLLSRHPGLPEQDCEDLYRSLLQLAFGATIDQVALVKIRDMVAGSFPGRLLTAMKKIHAYDPIVRTWIAKEISKEELARTLESLNGSQLVFAAAAPEAPKWFIDITLKELSQRTEYDSDLVDALRRHGFLADVFAKHYPGRTQRQIELVNILMTVAYHNRTFGDREFEDALTGMRLMPTTALIGIAAYLYGPGARGPIMKIIMERIDNSDIAEPVKSEILKNMSTSPAAREAGGVARQSPGDHLNWLERAKAAKEDGRGRFWHYATRAAIFGSVVAGLALLSIVFFYFLETLAQR